MYLCGALLLIVPDEYTPFLRVPTDEDADNTCITRVGRKFAASG